MAFDLLKLKPISVLLVMFVLLGLYYSFTTPLYEAPDEPAHYQYIDYLANGKGLPIQSFDRAKIVVWQGHQPPLYYMLGAILTFWVDKSNSQDINRYNPTWSLLLKNPGKDINLIYHTAAEEFPFRGLSLAIHLIRLLSIGFATFTVYGTYRLGRLITQNEVISLGAAGLVAFNPQFLFISGAVNNDNAVTAFSTLVIVMIMTILEEGPTRRRALWLGVCLGLALMSKANALVLFGVLAIMLGILIGRRDPLTLTFQLVMLIGLPVVVIAGWWFLRNQILYGDPFGYGMFLASASSIFAPADFGILGTWRAFVEYTHLSFWGNFGWGNIPLPPLLSAVFALLYPMAAIGVGGHMLQNRNVIPNRGHSTQSEWLLLIGSVAIFGLWQINFSRTNGISGFQGRYFFPAISAIAVLIVAGVNYLAPERLRRLAIGFLIGGFGVLAVLVPGQFIAPAYRYFTLPESVLQSIPHKLDHATFSSEIALAGYDVQNQDTQIILKLYWHAQGTPPQDHKVFVHVLNSRGQMCGQQDGLTQDGVFPMTVWRAGDVIQDIHEVQIDSSCWGKAAHHLDVGLYLDSTGQRLLYSRNDVPVSDHLEIPTAASTP